MIDLKQVHDMWQKDCVIDNYQLDDTSRKTPILHSKYIQLWSTAKLELKRAEFDQKRLLKEKWLYYNGKMDQDTVKEKGWEPDPFDGLKILKGEMDYYYDADQHIQEAQAKIELYKTQVETFKEILENIKWRHQTIKNMIEWRKFTSGV